MVPKIHAKGSSFKGAAVYLLHDKDRADTAERVVWTEARNLSVDEPDMAWRVMAATAMDQGRLKAAAGVPNTGRKSHKHVLHISLAWHPDQKPSREEMVRAADGALAAIGADDRQALIVAHNDEKHAHVHLLVNRVSPEDGRHLPSSNDRLKLSRWAEAYEREGGQILCEDRVINNEMRAKGQYVKGRRDQARHIYEARPPANDNANSRPIEAAQTRKDHALAQRGRNLAMLHAQAWEKLESEHANRVASAERRLSRDIAKATNEVREAFRPAWRELNRRQESERRTFEALEKTLFGRAGNIVRTVRLTAEDLHGHASGIISRSFRILTNAGKRREYFEGAQERDRSALERAQADKASEAVNSLKAAQRVRMAEYSALFLAKREELAQAQRIERAKLKEAWRDRTAERERAFTQAASRDRKPTQGDIARRRENPRLTPETRALLDSYLKDDFAKARRTAAREQDNERSNDRDDDRER